LITFHETHDDVDVAQLKTLFESVGWHARATDPARLAQIVKGSMFVVHAREGEKLVGFARAISDGASNAYVSTVVVHEDYRHKDIGTEMIRRLMAGRDGIQFVLHAAPRVHAFYKQCGFVEHPDCLVRKRAF
jgi:N-acetylglutamate synthase-like GNAT family acetyltransferase